MKLSEAITYGSTLRGESHDGPFVRIANTDELRSDVYGAACEAVHSLVAKRNWDKADADGYANDIEYLRGIQQKYFADYFKMPATCPGAESRPYTDEGIKVVSRQGRVERLGEREHSLPAITSICPSITNLAELIEHMFYIHNWSRGECAQAVDWYEQQGQQGLIQNFEHYQDERLRRSISERLTAVARQREQQRQSRRRIYAT